MASEYKPVPAEDPERSLPAHHEPKIKRERLSWLPLVLVLILTNTVSSLGGYYLLRQTVEERLPELPAHDKLEALSLDPTHKQFWWNTAYSDMNNASHTDSLWESILPSHGFIAIDRDFARSHGWHESMYLPSDHSMGVYLLEAYHYLHCLKILRKTMWEAVDGRPYTHSPGAHMNHCFDALRQYVVCNADSTPLYTFGDFTAGDSQVHQCKPWAQLREYATKHTACYRDSVEKIPLGDHFGFCDDGDDGVIEL